jgi:hypothetical protein
VEKFHFTLNQDIGLSQTYPEIDVTLYIIFIMIYLALRFVVIKRMLVAPIVFLRSFHDQKGTIAFGHAVMNTAIRYAPVIALTHPLQPPETLYREMRVDEIVRLYTSTDMSWQQWVTEHLQRCTAVIIDATQGTDGLVWEIEQAYALVPHERIIMLLRSPTRFDVPKDVQLLYYDIESSGKKQLRKELKKRLVRVKG